MNKFFSTTFLGITILTTSFLTADQGYEYTDTQENEIAFADTSKKDPSSSKDKETTDKSSSGEKDKKEAKGEKTSETDAKGEKPKPPAPTTGKFRFGSDALYWEAVQGQLAIGNKIVLSEDGEVLTNKIIRPSFGAMWGYKINAGYDFPGEEKWDVGATFGYLPMKGQTRYYTTNNPDPLNTTETILLKTLNYDILSTTTKVTGGQALSAAFATMQGFWKGYNYGLDMNFGRKFKVLSDTLTLRPYAGLRLRTGEQSYTFGGVVQPGGGGAPSTGITTMNVHIKEHFNAISGTGGFWLNWKVYKTFSIVTQFGVSCGYTRWTIHQRLNFYNTVATNNYDDRGFEKDTFPSIGFGVDYYAGVEYTYTYCNFDVKFKLGWEHHTSQQNVINSIGANLGTQGITTGLQVSF